MDIIYFVYDIEISSYADLIRLISTESKVLIIDTKEVNIKSISSLILKTSNNACHSVDCLIQCIVKKKKSIYIFDSYKQSGLFLLFANKLFNGVILTCNFRQTKELGKRIMDKNIFLCLKKKETVLIYETFIKRHTDALVRVIYELNDSIICDIYRDNEINENSRQSIVLYYATNFINFDIVKRTKCIAILGLMAYAQKKLD